MTAGPNRETTFEQWMRQEGLPVVSGYGVQDVEALELGPWARLGGRGAFIQLVGLEGLTGLFVAEIPPGGALAPEKHLYDELLYILSGRGATEVWTGGRDQPDGTTFFEWQQGSLFAPPGNTWHRLINGSGAEPTRVLGATNAPLLLDLFHNTEFVFNCDYRFTDRYDGRPDYFDVGQGRRMDHGMWLWDTNFIPDVRDALIDPQESKGAGVRVTGYEMGGNVLVGHLAEWPVGRYHKAHFHEGGAILLIVRSRGYTLMWPPEAGTQPYLSGDSSRVVRVDWRVGSVFSPPTGWFHQHFNTGREPARQLALRYGSHNHNVGFHNTGVLVSVKLGGTVIEYEDEDPEISKQYQDELARAGELQMPAMAGSASG